MPPGASSRIARRLISLYPRMAAGSEARVLANAGGSSTMVSNRSPADDRARRYSNVSASTVCTFVMPFIAKLSDARRSASADESSAIYRAPRPHLLLLLRRLGAAAQRQDRV